MTQVGKLLVCGRSGEAEAMETDEKAGEAAASEAEPKPATAPEASSFQMPNPSRVLPDQEKFIRFKSPAARFVPMKRAAAAGFVVLKDSQPGESPLRPMSNSNVADRPVALHRSHKASLHGLFCLLSAPSHINRCRQAF